VTQDLAAVSERTAGYVRGLPSAPGRAEVVPLARSRAAINAADLVVLNSDTLGAGVFEQVLVAAQRVRRVVVVGRSFGLHPRVLFDGGVAATEVCRVIGGDLPEYVTARVARGEPEFNPGFADRLEVLTVSR
jgi:uncharacterized protein (DUF4213/DUF364 family)